jgi:hypothetical protein
MTSDETGPAGAPSTVTEALANLAAAGYETNFDPAPGGRLRCGSCGAEHDPATAHVDGIARFEGETDPGDEAIVFALTCSACGNKGTLVSAYGASVDADEAEVVTALTDH